MLQNIGINLSGNNVHNMVKLVSMHGFTKAGQNMYRIQRQTPMTKSVDY